MNPWLEKVNASPALEKATQLKKVLVNLNLKNYNNEDRAFLERIEAVMDIIISKINDSDPRLINTAALTSIGNSMANVISYWNSWMDGKDQVYLHTHIQNELDTIVTQLVIISPTMDVPEARESISSLRRSVGQHRAVVDAFVNQVKEKGSLADITIDEKVAAASESLNEMEGIATSLGSELAKIKESSAQVAIEQQKAFTKAETERSAAFSTLLSDKQKELDNSVSELKNTTREEIAAIKEDVSSDQEAVVESKRRVEEILGIVSEEALIGDYSNNAKEERGAANFWRWVAAGSLALAICVAVWFSFTIDSTTAWQRVVAKIAIVLSFGGLAGYAAKQSGEHRHAQRDAEQMALQLKAIKPYLGDIGDQAKQDELLAKIADRLFGQDKVGKIDRKDTDPALLSQLIEALSEILKRTNNK